MSEAKAALDDLIDIARVHLYKPIQIAEVLFQSRTKGNINIEDLETYRNISKMWRDEVSERLVGRRSTSSQKYQDNVFDSNAMPIQLLKKLNEINIANSGMVENYIYHRCKQRWKLLLEIYGYLNKATILDFSLDVLLGKFTPEKGLKRSIDKAYEVAVHALFVAIVQELRAQITLEIKNPRKEILEDFKDFIHIVLGLGRDQTKISLPAMLYRAGVTNAADTGVDMWTNFGPIVQVKHLSLKEKDAQEIAESIVAERIIIVCLKADKETIETVLKQIGWGKRIQGIVTVDDLRDWYSVCFTKHASTIGNHVLNQLKSEFKDEFPFVEDIDPFLQERGYISAKLIGDWKIVSQAKIHGLG